MGSAITKKVMDDFGSRVVPVVDQKTTALMTKLVMDKVIYKLLYLHFSGSVEECQEAQKRSREKRRGERREEAENR